MLAAEGPRGAARGINFVLAFLLFAAAAKAEAAAAPGDPPGAPPQSPPPARASEELPSDEVVDGVLLTVLREHFYFTDEVRRRLENKASLRNEVRLALRRLQAPASADALQIERIDRPATRTALLAALPEADDPDAIRSQLRADLVRGVAPLPDDGRIDRAAQKRALDAAVRLLKEQAQIPGSDWAWGKVDVEVDRKFRAILAARAPQAKWRPWCVFAAWELLAAGQADRALGLSEACAKRIADEGQPADAELAAVRALALARLERRAEAKAAVEAIRTSLDPVLLRRVDAVIASSSPAPRSDEGR